jgi:phosphate transport system permease protein
MNEPRPLRPPAHHLSSSWLDGLIHGIFALAAAVPTAIALAMVGVFVYQSARFFQQVPLWNFLSDRTWTPLFSTQGYGIMVLVTATGMISTIALLVAIPVGTLAAIFLTEYAKDPLRQVLKSALETLSGIPTIVFGYFALFFVTPALRHIIPQLSVFNALSAGLVTGVLIVPTVSSICEDTLRSLPPTLKEGAYTLGMTQREVIQHVLLPAALPGLLAAYTLAASRSLGETMIAAIAAGQRPHLTLNPLVPVSSITAYIVQISLGDVSADSLRFHTIFAAGMVLFVMTLTLNSLGRWLLHRYRRAMQTFLIPTVMPRPLAAGEAAIATDLADSPLTFRAQRLRRRLLDTLLVGLGLASVILGIVVLALMALVAFRSGFSRLDWQFLTGFPSRRPEEAGIYAAWVGTTLLLVLTACLALPIGVAAAIYLEEYIPDRPLNRLLDVLIANLAAVPSILYGLLGLALFARQWAPVTGGRSLLSAALVMAIIALPLLIIATRNALRSVPGSLRRAAYSVGMSRLQALRHVILPAAAPGIITGITLALSRVVGEAAALIAIGAIAFVRTAPSLSIDGLQGPFSTLPTQIFFWAARPQVGFQTNAAAAILVLGGLVFTLNLAAVLLRDGVNRLSP